MILIAKHKKLPNKNLNLIVRIECVMIFTKMMLKINFLLIIYKKYKPLYGYRLNIGYLFDNSSYTNDPLLLSN